VVVFAFHKGAIVPIPVKTETEKMYFFDGCIPELGFVSKIFKTKAFTSKKALIAHKKQVFEYQVKYFNSVLLETRKYLKILDGLEECTG